MQTLEPYVNHIEDIVSQLADNKKVTANKQHIEAALNGELSKTLRELVPIGILQESGAFFTSEHMANHLVGLPYNGNYDSCNVLDASCGGGNLLLACARQLPLKTTLEETLFSWGRYVKGMDIHDQFVRATRARLALLAAHRGLSECGIHFFDGNLPSLSKAFPYIYTCNSLNSKWPEARTVLLNPPFNIVPVPDDCRWATGRVSQAAIFILKCVKEALLSGSIVRAILPDVLRSGTRYRKWRQEVERHSKIKSIEILGQFDSKTNVDVFLLTLQIEIVSGESNVEWVPSERHSEFENNVGDFCDVNVGRVVPHRDPENGDLYPYLDVNNVPQWATINPNKDYRRFLGKTFETPFVVVRRNSRASDINRAVGTLIVSDTLSRKELVAVENHLIVVRPKSGTIEDCEALLKLLHDFRTNNWLNDRIRCRHLTVKSIQNIPWW